uniref:Acrosin n=1 Tax=Culex tarsalis TaxID=7177 RepID=A0A1Q3FPY5_CULTA
MNSKRHQEVAWILAGLLLVELVGAIPLEAQQDTESRIVGGYSALEASTRHQVSIRRRSSDEAVFGTGHICGGSLIDNRTVLTAAHCLVDTLDRKRPADYFRVVGGNVNRYEQSPGTAIRTVGRVAVHERYNPKNFDNDVGLLILNEPVPAMHPALKPIAMALKTPTSLTPCQTSGWGSTQYGVSSGARELRAVNVTIQQMALCNGTSSYGGSLRAGMLCAGDFRGGQDACQGDSGGPLVCDGALAGVVSHGYKCAEPRFPGIYVDVAYYRDWIEREIARNGAGSSWRVSGISALGGVLIFFIVG